MANINPANLVNPFILLLLLFSLGCHAPRKAVATIPPPPPEPPRPKNIILLIGDGMGLAQVTAGLYSNDNHLNLERCPVTGLQKSYAADHLVTDSSAGATAFSCGKKTNNGVVGMDADSLPCPTILEAAEALKMATGMIVTSTIVHATPASFIAHQKSRTDYEAIAADLLKTDIDLFIGGGKKYFDARKTDSLNLYAALQEKGYYISDYLREPLELMVLPPQPVGYFTAEEDPRRWSEGRDYLPLACSMGMDFLKSRSDQGFFLMVEGSQIDWGGHRNDASYIVEEMLDFDAAIGVVLDWAEKDGETLVIITADHETGGLSINTGSELNSLKTAFTTTSHTACLIPVFAYGPGAAAFSGVYENTEIFMKMREVLKGRL